MERISFAHLNSDFSKNPDLLYLYCAQKYNFSEIEPEVVSKMITLLVYLEFY